jgi:hypothetical protein
MIQALAITFASLLFIATFITLVRRFSEWPQLQRHYSCSESQSHDGTPLDSYHGVSASARFARISLSVETYHNSVWLKPSFPLSVAMKAIEVPWHAMEDVSVRRGLFGDCTVIRIRHAEVPIAIKGHAGKRLFELSVSRRSETENTRAPGSVIAPPNDCA